MLSDVPFRLWQSVHNFFFIYLFFLSALCYESFREGMLTNYPYVVKGNSASGSLGRSQMPPKTAFPAIYRQS